MLVKDKKLKVKVNVAEINCPKFTCYWPRLDPGVFTQGQGYRERSSGPREWLCGNREIRGCPTQTFLLV
jgi:hypothetical protein